MTTEDEAEALRGRVRDLESALMIGNKAVRATFLLPPRLADILGILITQPVVPTETLTARLELASDAKVAMHRLRKHMAPFNITIHSRNRVGYWIDDADKAALKKLIEEKVGTSEVSVAA